MRFALEIVVFVGGGVVMALELAGSRILAPYVGTSIYVWTALIGVILGALSLGYWGGGVWADRHPTPSMLSAILLIASLAVTAAAFLDEPVLEGALAVFPDVRAAAVAATLLLFGVPSVLLGAVSPFAARLQIRSKEHSGAAVGRLYALSTLGSIAGTFLTGFVLFAYWSHTTTLFVCAAALAVLSALLSAGRARGLKITAALALLSASALPQVSEAAPADGTRLDLSSAYNRIWVYDRFHGQSGRPIRILQVNDEHDSAMFLDGDDLALEYTKYYRLADQFHPRVRRALMVGGAAYSYPKRFLAEHPDAKLDVVEIDPAITRVARRYFRLEDDPRLSIFHEDARTFLNRGGRKYDAVFLDAFRSYVIPFQLTTLETMRRVRGALEEDGVAVANLIGSVEGETGRFVRAETATWRAVFPRVMLFAVEDPDDAARMQNLILVGLCSDKNPSYAPRSAETAQLLSHIWVGPVAEDLPALTDDFAPVERYAGSMPKRLSSVLRRSAPRRKGFGLPVDLEPFRR